MTSSVTSSFKKQGLSLGHQKQPAEVTGWGTVTRFCSRLPPHLPVSSTTRELKLSKSSAKRNGWFHERRSSLNCPIWTSPRYLTGCRNPLNGGGVGSQVSSLSSKRADLFPRPLTPATPRGSRADSHGFGIVWLRGSKSLSATMCLECFSPTRTQLTGLTTSLVSWKPFKTFKLSSTTTNGFKIIQTMRGGGKGKSEWKYTSKLLSLSRTWMTPACYAWI